MDKVRRSERLSIISKFLADRPGELISLNTFTDMFHSAKSSISEDLAILRNTYIEYELGHIVTLPGVAGGVIYRPSLSDNQAESLTARLCQLIDQPERILPGGFLYLTDLIGDPLLMNEVGMFFARVFVDSDLDAVLTIETKGIPIAMMTARILNLPLVIVRSDSRVSEGTSVGISYLSGTQRRLLTMSLPKRAIARGSRVLFIDDFMRGGGTAKGILDLMSEFDSQCVGMGFLVDVAGNVKLVSHYTALLSLQNIDPTERSLTITKGNW